MRKRVIVVDERFREMWYDTWGVLSWWLSVSIYQLERMQCGELPLPQLFCEVQCSMLWFGRSWAMFNVSARFVISRLICYVL